MLIQPYTSSPALRCLLRQVCAALKVLAAGNSFSGMTNTPPHSTSPVHKTFLAPKRACTKSVIDESFRPKVATKLSLFSQLSAPIKSGPHVRRLALSHFSSFEPKPINYIVAHMKWVVGIILSQCEFFFFNFRGGNTQHERQRCAVFFVFLAFLMFFLLLLFLVIRSC